MTRDMILGDDIRRRVCGPGDRQFWVVAVLFALNWPCVYLIREPDAIELWAAIVAAAALAGLMILAAARVAAPRSGRIGLAVATAGVLSIGTVVAYVQLGDAVRTSQKTIQLPNPDAQPQRQFSGLARESIPSAIPVTTKEMTVCATPVFATNQPTRSAVAVWLIEFRERRPGQSGQQAVCSATREASPFDLVELPLRKHSSLVFDAVRDSAKRWNIEAASRPILAQHSEARPASLNVSVLGPAVALALMNVLLLVCLNSMPDPKRS